MLLKGKTSLLSTLRHQQTAKKGALDVLGRQSLCRPLTAGRAEAKGKGFSFAATSLVGGNLSQAAARYKMPSATALRAAERLYWVRDRWYVGLPSQRLMRRFEGWPYRWAAKDVATRAVGGKEKVPYP